MGVVELNDGNFKKEVLEAEGTVVVDFFAEWCGPCKIMGPIFEELAGEAGDKAKFCKLNVDGAQKTAAEYGVMSIPTFIIFRDGEKSNQLSGVQGKEDILELL